MGDISHFPCQNRGCFSHFRVCFRLNFHIITYVLRWNFTFSHMFCPRVFTFSPSTGGTRLWLRNLIDNKGPKGPTNIKGATSLNLLHWKSFYLLRESFGLRSADAERRERKRHLPSGKCLGDYLSRMNIAIGVTLKFQRSRILFSRKRRYGFYTSCKLVEV